MSVVPVCRLSADDLALAFSQLKDFVAIPSVSNPGSPDYNMETLCSAADFAGSLLKGLDFCVEQISIDGSAPFVIGEKIVSADLPTLLFYAHYDLQPVDRYKWDTDPFVLTEKDGRLYGRGASDDKGGIIAIVTALGVYLRAHGALPCNVRVLFEGEEEYHSTHMSALLRQEASRLQADAMIIMDGGNVDLNRGTLTTSTRGLVNLTVTVETMKAPVHSGIACLVQDPSAIMADLMTSLKHPETIPGFLEDRNLLNETERELLRASSQTVEEYASDHNVFRGVPLRGDPTISVYERIAEEPSISFINGDWGQPNGGNSIQNLARCQVGIRITAGQDPDKIIQVVTDYLLAQDARGALVTVDADDGSFAWKGDLSKPLAQKYISSIKENFEDVHLQPTGGALPFLHEIEKSFPEMEVIIPGVEDPKTAAHSHNESQDISLFEKAVNTVLTFFSKL